VDIDNTRAHIGKREQQRMRGKRIIDITVCVTRALSPLAFAHLEARAIGRADNGERGGAAGTAPAAGNPEHDLHD